MSHVAVPQKEFLLGVVADLVNTGLKSAESATPKARFRRGFWGGCLPWLAWWEQGKVDGIRNRAGARVADLGVTQCEQEEEAACK
jgi:hypothetical protein